MSNEETQDTTNSSNENKKPRKKKSTADRITSIMPISKIVEIVFDAMLETARDARRGSYIALLAERNIQGYFDHIEKIVRRKLDRE